MTWAGSSARVIVAAPKNSSEKPGIFRVRASVPFSYKVGVSPPNVSQRGVDGLTLLRAFS